MNRLFLGLWGLLVLGFSFIIIVGMAGDPGSQALMVLTWGTILAILFGIELEDPSCSEEATE